MEYDLLFKIFLFISPFISAFLASYLTYRFGIRSKKIDYLYQSRIPAYKEISTKLVEAKRYCLGKISEHSSNEFSPYYDLAGSGLQFRIDIAHVVDANEMFLTDKSKAQLANLDEKFSLLTNAEASMFGLEDSEEKQSFYSIYPFILAEIELCLNELYSELGFPVV
ncbi:hypothetical protein [Xanthocytophaga flava]|uniref:hypothetical protein n=1 Tax=Xanthocytophaga flava TaxID=3048013 RepID=UPI0028D6AE1D|nr:hypothetical protein [Xanthocytophaga flavus]MDJ1472856.1 hypothetical protein [Xanthocytophaga flavus]